MDNPFRKDHKYLYGGLTALAVIIVSILFCAIILNLGICWEAIRTVLRILAPIIYGFAFAYILNPLMRKIEHLVMKCLKKATWKARTKRLLARSLGVVGAILIMLAIVYLLLALLLPQLWESVSLIINNLPNYYKVIEAWLTKNLINHPTIGAYLSNTMDSVYKSLLNWATTKLAGNIQAWMVTLTGSVVTVFKAVLHVVIGLIVAVYMLMSKERFQAQTKKLITVLFRPKRANRIFEIGRRAHTVFGGFIIGKIVDSLIMGVLCYLCMLVFRLPFPALIATIVGVTNIIPFFGPFIGAIPSAFIILLNSPIKCLYFIILVLVLQQIDGNIIGPRILGNATGLSGFWVIVAITFFGGLFGFVGMIIGVPVFAMIYILVSENVNKRLRVRNLPTATEQYLAIQLVDELSPQAEENDTTKQDKA